MLKVMASLISVKTGRRTAGNSASSWCLSQSPGLRLAARLWPLSNESVVNRTFASLVELDWEAGERCVTLSAMPELVGSYTSYHWSPAMLKVPHGYAFDISRHIQATRSLLLFTMT
mgnify:CR=1 FL=1